VFGRLGSGAHTTLCALQHTLGRIVPRARYHVLLRYLCRYALLPWAVQGKTHFTITIQLRLITRNRLVLFSCIHQWLHSLLLGPGLFFSFVIFSYTVGRIPWTSDQPVARPLPTHRATQTQNKRAHRHSCIECDSNPRSQRSSERRQFVP
jgi:hypothetical protein